MAKLFSGKRNHFLILAIALLSSTFYKPECPLQAAEPNASAADARIQQKSSGSYCGIYCLYSAMKFYRVDVEPNELFKPEYIGSPAGSTLAELKSCAETYGLYAVPVARLTTKNLRNLPGPMILHVKSSQTGRAYNHYELLLRTSDNRALVYDPPIPVKSVLLRTLAPRWDGSGLIVSNKPIHIRAVLAPARQRFVAYALIVILLVLLIRRQVIRRQSKQPVTSRKQTIWLSVGEGATLLLAAFAVAFAYNSINDEGLLAYKEGTANIQKAYQATFIPKLTNSQAQRLFANQQTVFVDPRQDYEFKAGHLKDSINVPAYMTKDEIIKAMGTIDKSTELVVYCSYSNRLFADIVACGLINDGFTNVRIYKGNWDNWQANTCKTKDKKTDK